MAQRKTGGRNLLSQAGTGSSNAEADQLLNAVKGAVPGLQATFGRKCEVVLHDYRKPAHSAIAVAGDVTGRLVGSPMSEIGLGLMRQGDAAEDKLNYMIRLPGGRTVKSSTMLLRLSDGHVVGALCINIDVTEIRQFAGLLAEFVADGDQAETTITTFGNDMSQIVDAAFAKVERSLGRPLERLTSAEMVEVFRTFDELGLFQLKRSVPMIAKRLGLSRASAYSYLARVRDEAAPAG